MPALAGSDGSPDGYDSWEEYFDSLIRGGTSKEIKVPPLEQMAKADENPNFILYFHEDGLDFYITDKRSNKLWSTAIHPDYMDVSKKKPEEYSALLEVLVANKEGTISQHSLTEKSDSEFQVESRIEKGRVLLHISVAEKGISFDFALELTQEGFIASIPEDSIEESGDNRLIAVSVLPQFGAAKTGEDGYLFYPDGSGALIDIQPYALPLIRNYSYPLYGMSDPDVDEMLLHEDQDIKNLMLPVFGIKHSNGGFLAVAEQGDADATLTMEITDCYKAWFKFDYRRYVSAEFNFTGTSQGGGEISKLLEKRIKGDKTVRYFLLPGESGTYSDMASAYRNWLEKKGVLTRMQPREVVPLSIEFFMAVTKKGIFGNRLEKITTYRQAANILSDLANSGVNSVQTLLTGWSKGGYEAMPTPPEYAMALGGKRNFKALSKICDENGFDLFLNCEYLLGNKDHRRINTKKNILKDLLGTGITGKKSSLVFMNPEKTLFKSVEKSVKKSDGNWKISLSSIGNLVLPNSYERDVIHRTEVIDVYRKTLEYLKSRQGIASVSGGNAYVLPYAKRMYEIPDRDSQYTHNSRPVPFYQMVVHGYLDYTSVAGNMSESEQIQKLRWVETGSLPHYLITGESPVALKDTAYNRIFSSEYVKWKDSVKAVFSEFNQRLKKVWDQPIIRHEQLDGNLVCVTYENGMKTYINYSLEPKSVDGIQVPPEDYVVTGGDIQ